MSEDIEDIDDIDPEAPWGGAPEDRWVRLMCDSLGGGLWDREGCGRYAEELPIAPALAGRIEAWQAWYDEEERHVEAGTVVELSPRFDVPAFQAEGEAIANALRQALPGWTVVCGDHLKR